MSTGRGRRGGPPAAMIEKDPDPSPTPLEFEEMEGAKKKVRGRKRGRFSTILAGRLMSQQGKSVLGE